jgi:hypothetical protein
MNTANCPSPFSIRNPQSAIRNGRFDRRDFLKIGAGLFGLSLPQLLRLEALSAPVPKRADAVILVWLAGGPASIDMWDLKPDAPDGIRGEFKPIATKVADLRICEHLPRVAQVADRVTVVRSMQHTIPWSRTR